MRPPKSAQHQKDQTAPDLGDGLICNKCKQLLPFDSFYRNRRLARGYARTCKACLPKRKDRRTGENKRDRSKYFATYYDNHKEAIIERVIAKRKGNAEDA